MSCNSIEHIDKTLIHKNIEFIKPPKREDCHFERCRHFDIFGKRYTIEWWNNICYLKHQELTIIFCFVEQSNTWPNNAKLNLQFKDNNGNTVCILPIDYYEL